MKSILFVIVCLLSSFSYCQQIDQTVIVCQTSPNEIKLYSIGSGQYIYNWYVEGGMIISGDYTNEIEVDWTAVDTGLYKVYASIMNIYGCSDTSEIVIHITGCPFSNMFLPNVFTPDDDHLNDIFIPIGHFDHLTEYKMAIWNKWGQHIYESDNVNIGWDGTINGEPCQNDAYVYFIEFKVYDKNMFRLGQVVLIR